MMVATLSIDEVQVWEKNARIHPKRNLEALKASLLKYGQTKPILVQKSSMRIIAGNGTYQAICALGWNTVDCRILDLSDSDAEALMIADNRIGDLSDWDEQNLLDSLQSLKELGTLELTGYDELELDKMLSFKERDAFANLQEELKPLDEIDAVDLPQPDNCKKAKSKDDTASYENQINFTINGFIFSLADEERIESLRELTSILKEADDSIRQAVNDQVFEAIEGILEEKFR